MSERAVGLEYDACLQTCLEQPGTMLVGAELHLIDCWNDLSHREQRVQFVVREV